MNLYRMTEVLILLNDNEIVSNNKLACELGVTQDAIKYDIKHLKEMGYDIKHIPGTKGGNKYYGNKFKNTKDIVLDTFMTARDYNYENGILKDKIIKF